jgi:CRISPR-associated Cas5-like protein
MQVPSRVGASLRALTFKARFFTAQFKDHLSKLTRRTYLIPPPSAVAGIFGAILGLKREELAEVSKEMLAGAELRSLGGRVTTLARIFKFDRTPSQLLALIRKYQGGEAEVIKEIRELLPIEESEEMYMPEYRLAIASSDESLLEEGARRLKDLDFEYEVFGGNDYHLPEFVGDPRPARMYKSREGYGYCPREDFERVEAESFDVVFNMDAVKQTKVPMVMPIKFLANVNADFVQVYGAKIVARRELNVVDDGESKVFVYQVSPFLLM